MPYITRALNTIQIDATISAATELTLPSDTRYIVLQAFTNGVYYTIMGETPSTANGMYIAAGGSVEIHVSAETVIKVIEATASAEIRWYAFGLLHIEG